MDIKTKPCHQCGKPLTSAKTLGKLYCSTACTVDSYKLKEKAAPALTPAQWRQQVAEQVRAGKAHPNPQHLANRMLDLIRSKTAELQELQAIRKKAISY